MNEVEKMKILIVDDKPENLLALESLLRMPTVEFHKAASGHEALDLLLTHEFALAMLDVQMPDMDGFELAELMRGTELTRSVPIIFVTAGAHDRLNTFKGYEKGAVDFLHKPLDPHIVKGKVMIFLELAQQRHQLRKQVAEMEGLLKERDSALEEAREALRTRDEFMSIASHELKTPLTAFHLQLQLMGRTLAKETIFYAVFSGGKRIRPRILSAVSETLSLPSRIPTALGIGLELIHTYTLIHDDLPLFSLNRPETAAPNPSDAKAPTRAPAESKTARKTSTRGSSATAETAGAGAKDDLFREKAAATPKQWTVSELTARIKGVLEPTFSEIWLQGEVSNCRPAASGHLYFSLKDEGATISAAMFGLGGRKRLQFDLKDGMQVLVRGKVSVYAPRGNYQFIADHLEPMGSGALQLAFEQLKAKLAAEGLFDPKRKRQLPPFPRRLAIVTSPSGAAIRDMLNILKRRAPHLEVLVIPAIVIAQAVGAPEIDALLTDIHHEQRTVLLHSERGQTRIERCVRKALDHQKRLLGPDARSEGEEQQRKEGAESHSPSSTISVRN